ncbi:hypothetical protein D3C81_999360 [compost metagenome]
MGFLLAGSIVRRCVAARLVIRCAPHALDGLCGGAEVGSSCPRSQSHVHGKPKLAAASSRFRPASANTCGTNIPCPPTADRHGSRSCERGRITLDKAILKKKRSHRIILPGVTSRFTLRAFDLAFYDKPLTQKALDHHGGRVHRELRSRLCLIPAQGFPSVCANW